MHLYDSETRIAEYLREETYAHVLLNQSGLDFVIEEGESPLRATDVGRLKDFIENHLALVDRIGHYRLYKLER